MLPDEPRRAVRSGRRGRRRQRPRQHGRNIRRRPPGLTVRARRRAVGDPRPLRGDVAALPRGERRHADAHLSRRRRSEVSGRSGAAVAHGPARAGRADHARPLPGRRAPVHPRRAALAPSRLQPPRRRLGRAARRQQRRSPAAAARRGALAAPAGGSGRALSRPRGRSRDPPRRRRRRRDLPGLVRGDQQGDRRRDDRRLRLPDRLDDEGLDGVGRDAARRRGEARSRRADRRRAARAGALRSGREGAAHDAPSPHAHERHRRRHLHGHRPGRRLSRALRRPARGGCAEPSARGDVVVLQLRLLARRPGDREGHRRAPGTPRSRSVSSGRWG